MCLTLPSACVLIGLEPDEIDVAVGSETGEAESAGGTEGGATGDTNNTDGGDGDPGDGDPGDPTTGDGDPGDGDPGDGDPGDGDGDPNETPCASAVEVFDGSNVVTILDGPSLFDDDCAVPGPESIYRYTATATGAVQLVVDMADFTGSIYLLDDSCAPISGCAIIPDMIEVPVSESETIYLAVDSDAGGGMGNLEITPIP